MQGYDYWGIAWSWRPSLWRLGWKDALDDNGRKVGDWFFLGPVALMLGWD